MQAHTYTDGVIERLDAYARSLPKAQHRVSYGLVHPEVFVPLGMLPIQIAQFRRADPARAGPQTYHWSIFVPTSHVPGVGHYYELAGDAKPYHVQSTIDAHNARGGMARGNHTVGFVLPVMMRELEAHLARVPVVNLRLGWGSQQWVCEALEGLNHPLMFSIAPTMEQLATQMGIVSDAWERGEIS